MVSINGFVTGTFSEIGNKIGHLPAAELIIFEIGVILIISAIFAFIAKMLKQPLIPAYILTGLLIGPLALGLLKNMDLISAFSEIGIAFLLFVAGLEISFKKIKEANLKKIAIIGLFQVAIIFGVAVLLSGWLNLSTLQAAYIGIILAFGSTMVDIKLLADKKELVTLHGRLVLGILLFQDLVAIIAIVIFTTGGFAVLPIAISFAKLLGMVAGAMVLQKFVLDRLFKFAAKSSELLFLSSLAVLFLFIITSYVLELSIVIGAFIAGVSLANSPFKLELESRISPLRDFFAILFFVALGIQIVFTGIGERLLLLGALLVGAMIIKPIITLVLLRITGYQAKTSFMTSVSLAQLSEFSLIIGMLGVSVGVLDMPIFSTIILATIITMSVTPYFIEYKERMYKIFKYPIKILKYLPIKETSEYDSNKKYEILLIGAHRSGSVLLKKFMKDKEKLLVLDHNPEVINKLVNNKISCIYGDLNSPEIFNKINLRDLKLVISTVPNYKENLRLIKILKEVSPRTKVVVTGSRISETLELYSTGADYVITPKILAGEEVSRMIKSKKQDFRKLRSKHLKKLKEIHKLLY
jgi:Kef-type K+ transport system membrane component KefB